MKYLNFIRTHQKNYFNFLITNIKKKKIFNKKMFQNLTTIIKSIILVRKKRSTHFCLKQIVVEEMDPSDEDLCHDEGLRVGLHLLSDLLQELERLLGIGLSQATHDRDAHLDQR
jgi:hypothetical protein